MKTWQEIILEAFEKDKLFSERQKRKKQQKRRLKTAKTSVAASNILNKNKGKTKKETPKDSGEYLQVAKGREKRKQEYFDWMKGREERKKVDAPLEKARQSLSNIKTQNITTHDADATAAKKNIENAASIAGGLAKAGVYGIKALMAKREGSNQPEKRIRKPIGRPPKSSEEKKSSKITPVSVSAVKPQLPGGPERKLLSPERKRLVPSTKRLPPFGGVPEVSRGTKAMTLGQRARQNPKIKSGLIQQRMNEEYSNWREEFIFELRDSKGKKEIVDVLGNKKKNNIILNPEINEEKDYEGEMSRNELDTMERAIKSLRKKIKKSNQQLPAWVQSKITKATDHIDTVADYMSGEHEKIDEEYIEEIGPLLAIAGRLAAGAAGRAVASRVAAGAASDTIRGALAKKAGEITADTVKNKIEKKFLNKPNDEDSRNQESPLQPFINMTKFSEDWQSVNRKDKTDGLSQAAVDAYRRENPGSKLQTAVTEKKPGGKRAKRRMSFCRRMKGMKKKLTSGKTARNPNSRINKALRRWRCR